MSIVGRTARVLGTAVITLGFVVGAGLPVSAAQTSGRPVTGNFHIDGGAIRTCAWRHCTRVGLGYRNQQARMHCFVVGESLNGDSTWLRLTNLATGVEGYSHVSVISDGGVTDQCP